MRKLKVFSNIWMDNSYKKLSTKNIVKHENNSQTRRQQCLFQINLPFLIINIKNLVEFCIIQQ